MVKKETLPNGVRIITERVTHVQSVAIGIWANAGGRNEEMSNLGISHFIEHMLFKGTTTRSARQIADEFDSLGGQLNAFTDKEYTCYYAKVLSEHLPNALDVLSDMFMNSTLDKQEMDLEKKVVLEEIKRHEDTPDELIHDMFAESIWSDHPLGRSLLGTEKSVSSLSRSDLRKFMGKWYAPDGIVITAAGNLVHQEVVDKISSLFGHLSGKSNDSAYVAPAFTPHSKMTDKTTEQVHMCIGTKGCSHLDQRKYALTIIDVTLGGGMSSRLFQEIREKRGLAYAIGSYSVAYRDCGFFTVYGGTSMENVDQVKELVLAEFKNVRDSNITNEEMTRAKNQIRGSLVLGLEGMSSRMIRLAKSEIYFGRVIPIKELIELVMNVTHEDIEGVAQYMFDDQDFPIVAIGPFNEGKAGKI